MARAQPDDESGKPSALVRVGMFGGAFNPPHCAHAALARAAIGECWLDRLYVMPTGNAWHRAGVLASAADRIAMCELAFQDIDRCRVDARETKRDGPTYTIDTLLELRSLHPGAKLFLLVGADQAAAMPKWHRTEDIFKLATIIVAARALPICGSALFDSKFPADLVAPDAHVLRLAPASNSASDVRSRISLGQPIDTLVDPAVARYIAQHHLYQTA